MLQRFLKSTRLSSEAGAGVLLVVAAPAEVQAVLRGLGLDPTMPVPAWSRFALRGGLDLVLTGIGKANAAGAAARAMDPARHALVLNVGIGGALPTGGSSAGGLAFEARPGSVHIASACVFADEGLETPGGFVDCATLGFPLGEFAGNSVPTDPAVVAALAPLGAVGPIATVSTCSGTDALAQRTAQRTLALVEAMEGAAVALVAHRLGVAMAEVRVVSNTTGDRERQVWAIRPALDVLAGVIGNIFGNLR